MVKIHTAPNAHFSVLLGSSPRAPPTPRPGLRVVGAFLWPCIGQCTLSLFPLSLSLCCTSRFTSPVESADSSTLSRSTDYYEHVYSAR